MCASQKILQKLSLPRLATLLLLFPVFVLLAFHLSVLSLLWITGKALWESCPNMFVLPKQSIPDSRVFAFVLVFVFERAAQKEPW